jgi:hypothetical protein
MLLTRTGARCSSHALLHGHGGVAFAEEESGFEGFEEAASVVRC